MIYSDLKNKKRTLVIEGGEHEVKAECISCLNYFYEEYKDLYGGLEATGRMLGMLMDAIEGKKEHDNVNWKVEMEEYYME